MVSERIRSLLPSKKVAIALGIVIAVLLAVFLIERFGKETHVKQPKQFGKDIPAVPAVVLEQAFGNDADQDGIADWEESLWGTDPNNKDTDADGISDGAFIMERKQFLKNQSGGEVQMTAPQSESELFQRQLYAAVAYLEQSDQLTPARQDELTDVFIAYVNQVPNTGITAADLKTVPDDASVRQTYLLQIDDFFKIHKNNIIPAAVAEMFQAARLGNVPDELHDSVAIPYGRMIDQLRNITVPESMIAVHLQLVNTLIAFKVTVIDGLAQVEEQPLYALRAVSQFEDRADAIETALNDFKRALLKLR